MLRTLVPSVVTSCSPRLKPHQSAEIRAPRPRIYLDLIGSWRQRALRQDFDLHELGAGTSRQTRRAHAVARQVPKRLLYQTIFQGMKGQDHQASTRSEHAGGADDELVEAIELVVYGDSQRLERAGCRMNVPRTARNRGADDIGELVGRAQFALAARGMAKGSCGRVDVQYAPRRPPPSEAKRRRRFYFF